MTANVLPSYGASNAALEGIKSEMNDKASQKLVFGDSPLMWKSPWILPAYVVSNERDAEKRPIVQVAKCTIDTGNMQGNIVSRSLVELLGFPSSMFDKLTEEEERGGSGITGDLHIPQGAIYLTWYHNNSTRVFRNMRFLISPSDSCDLVIGAWSVQKDKILDVPCLMASPKPHEREGVIQFTPAEIEEDSQLEVLLNIHLKMRGYWNEAKNDLMEKNNTNDKAALEFVRQTEAEVDVSGRLLDVHVISKKSRNDAQKLGELPEIWEELDVNWHIMRDELPKDIQQKLENAYRRLTKEFKLTDNRAESKKLAQEMKI